MFEGLSYLVSLERSWTDIARDLADIAIVAFIIYRALLVLKGTRAMQMGVGFGIFGLLYVLAKYAALATLLSVLSWLASSIILIAVVVFQNDIRRALIRVGAKAWLTRGQDAQTRVIEEVVAAATELARHRMGALIVIERDASVIEFVKSDGILMDSLVTRELLVSLFIPESVNKTHDGAVLLRNLRIARAGIFLPMPEGTRIVDPTLGSRHRAAVGITEETDAIVVVVSEERGTVTLCFPNGMVQNLDAASLKQALLGLLGSPEKSARSVLWNRLFRSRDESDAASKDDDLSANESKDAKGGARSASGDAEAPTLTPPPSVIAPRTASQKTRAPATSPSTKQSSPSTKQSSPTTKQSSESSTSEDKNVDKEKGTSQTSEPAPLSTKIVRPAAKQRAEESETSDGLNDSSKNEKSQAQTHNNGSSHSNETDQTPDGPGGAASFLVVSESNVSHPKVTSSKASSSRSSEERTPDSSEPQPALAGSVSKPMTPTELPSSSMLREEDV